MSTYDFNLITAFANSAPSNEIEPFPDYDRGLGIAFVETDGKPEMKGLNGLFSLMTVSLLALKQRGILTWKTGFEYKQGAFAVESNRLYQAKVDNTSKQPSLSQNEWQVWASVSDIDVDTNGNIIKTAKMGGAFTLRVEDASTTVKGAARFATATEVANKDNVMAAVTPANVAAISQTTGVGIGQTWKNLTASRVVGVAYKNTGVKPIQVLLSGYDYNGAPPMVVYVDNILIAQVSGSASFMQSKSISVILPPQQSIKVDGGFQIWAELN